MRSTPNWVLRIFTHTNSAFGAPLDTNDDPESPITASSGLL